jgi:hypothetical protein
VAPTSSHGTTTASYGAYYHQPATVNYYGGSGCYNCGGSGWGYAGAALAGAAVGTAVGATVASANTTNAYNAGVAAGSASGYAAGVAAGASFAVLPAGCAYSPSGGRPYYYCSGGGGYWLMPAYGANGLYYRAVAAP